MNAQEILQNSKTLTLNYLQKIGANIEELHGLYTIAIPTKYEGIFGGITKRITFDLEVASMHGCELVVPGSNFLAIILNEIKKQAPVVGGHLKKLAQSPENYMNKISTHNCHAIFENAHEELKIAVRLYFFVTVKSIKNASMLRWIDIDLETLNILEFPSEIDLDQTLGSIKYEKNDQRIDHCYVKATEILESDIESLAVKYVDLTKDNLERDLNSLDQLYTKRIKEINQDIDYQNSKLREFNRKITSARHTDTQRKYVKQKHQQEERIQKAKDRAVEQIGKLLSDKDIQVAQIEKRYRPVIDFSLIAGQVFSYSTSNCAILFKNNFAQKQLSAIFSDPSLSFSIKCEICDQNLETIHLCVNSHVGCDNCIRHCVKCSKDVCLRCTDSLKLCYICKEGLCSDCFTGCQFCSEITCEKHMIGCPHCMQRTCFFCSDKCEICSIRLCDGAFCACNSCKKRICQKDTRYCNVCKYNFCIADTGICAICNNIHCKNDTITCKLCEQIYDKNCISDQLCISCKNMQEVENSSPIIQEAIVAYSDLKKVKKCECASNSKYSMFKIKKLFGSKFIVYDRTKKQVIISKKGGWR
jgi:hypothetical protein